MLHIGIKEMTMMAILILKKYNDEEILRLIKSLTHPYPCAWGIVMGKKVRISKAEKAELTLMELQEKYYT